MFDVGFAELFLLAIVGLLVLGPERLPAVARTLGGLIRKARTSWYTLRRSIETELASSEVNSSIKAAHQGLQDVSNQLTLTDHEPAPESTAQAGDEETGGTESSAAPKPPPGD